MKYYSLPVALLLMLLTACHGSDLPVSFPAEFSVQWRGREPGEDSLVRVTLVRVRNRMIRMEGREGMIPYVVLYDNNERAVYSWHPGETSAVREPLDQPEPLILFPEEAEWRFMEEVTIEGKRTRKYRCVARRAPHDEAIVWVDAESRLIVRTEDDGYTMDWTRYSSEEQDARLFRPPQSESGVNPRTVTGAR